MGAEPRDDLRWRTPLQALVLILTGRTFTTSVRVALIVGTVLTLVNQSPALSAGHLDLALVLRVLANYLIPYTVSSIGYLSAFRDRDNPAATVGRPA